MLVFRLPHTLKPIRSKTNDYTLERMVADSMYSRPLFVAVAALARSKSFLGTGHNGQARGLKLLFSPLFQQADKRQKLRPF